MNATWRAEQLDEVFRFFKTSMTLPTLYARVNKSNPQHSFEAVARQDRRYRGKGYLKPREELTKNLRRGFLDIEATHLKANFGFILSWYIKPEHKREYHCAVVTRDEILDPKIRDKRVVVELLKAFENYDELWAHYGADGRFDIPYIRTRALILKVDDLFPQKGEKFIKDTWEIARKKLVLHSNRLEVIAKALGIKNVSKTTLDPAVWQDAMYGDEKALRYVETHNKHDVILLERVYHRIKRFDQTPLRSM